jgi:hypothetical protein
MNDFADHLQLPVLDCTPLFSGAPLDEAAATRLASALRLLADLARLRAALGDDDESAVGTHPADATDRSRRRSTTPTPAR